MGDMPRYIEFARELRKKQTPEEKILWKYLRNRRMMGFKFLRQHPILFTTTNGDIDFYVADFYCSKKKLVLELDGPIHWFQRDFDESRDDLMKELGLKVVRIENDKINFDLEDTLEFIRSLLR